MSDIEEPSTKVSKYEMSQTFTQVEEMENGQEEWLSDGLLTDEEYNPSNEQDDGQSDSALGNTSQNSNSLDNINVSIQDTSKLDDSNIEDTLNSLNSDQQNELPAELNTFLVRKTESKAPAVDNNAKAEESDGNDTDDLLRMLEDDDKTKKSKKTSRKEKLQPKPAASEDDDEFIFKSLSVQKLKVAKSVLRRTYPAAKAVPEDSSDEESSNDARAMKKMLTPKRKNYASKSTSKTQKPTPAIKVTTVAGLRKAIKKRPPVKTKPPKNKLKPITTQIKEVVQPTAKPVAQPVVKPVAKPVTQPTAQRVAKAVAQPVAKPVAQASPAPVKRGQQVVRQVVRHVHANKVVEKTVDRIIPAKEPEIKPNKAEWQEPDEIIDEAEFLEDDNFDLDEDFAVESDSELDRRAVKQRIMRPEQLDEDMLSDADTHSEDDFYDELPSSDSDDLDDWFTLDIRSERAGDYLPLLGSKAYELLLEEKKRVSLRLVSLRESIGSLSENGRKQSEKLKSATEKLVEIDDLLKAS